MSLRFRKPKYEVILWTVHVTVTALAILDRFTTNAWPRQAFSIGGGSAGNDRVVGFKEGPWSVVAYDVLARISGRFSIVCFNFMLISRLRILEQCLASSWIGKYFLDCSNITKSNIQAHKWNGIALCVLTLLHVWSILMPCVVHGWYAQVVPGHFEWPLSERSPKGFKDADAETQTMSLQVDDVFRMVEMSLFLGVLTPLSIRWMAKCWHLGIHVHRFVTVVYFVDIVRRHSHPHSWVLNTPVFVIWILDKLACLFWRRVKCPSVTRQTISHDYTVFYWTVDGASSREPFNEVEAVGNNFLMRANPSSWAESPHPFTSFKNRAGNCDFLLTADSGGCHREGTYFTHGAVIRTFHDVRKPRIGGEKQSHTERMLEEDSTTSLSIWGPFQGEVTNLIPRAFPEGGNGSDPAKERSIILAGSGSAINFMIDIMSQLSCGTYALNQIMQMIVESSELKQIKQMIGILPQLSCDMFDIESSKLKQIVLLYSTRDIALYEWVVIAMDKLLSAIDTRFKNTDGSKKIRIVLAFTGNVLASNVGEGIRMDQTWELGEDLSYSSTYGGTYDGSEEYSSDEEGQEDTRKRPFAKTTKQAHSSGHVELFSKRLDYRREIPDGSYVFCQGSAGFKSVVTAGCRGKRGVRLFLDQ